MVPPQISILSPQVSPFPHKFISRCFISDQGHQMPKDSTVDPPSYALIKNYNDNGTFSSYFILGCVIYALMSPSMFNNFLIRLPII